jgi:multidrug efflux system outer membrane protein
MKNKLLFGCIISVVAISFFLGGCKSSVMVRNEKKYTPPMYRNGSVDSTNSAMINWRKIFADSNLIALIDTALKNNQELNITLMDIEVNKNEIKSRQGEYLPFGSLRFGAGVQKTPKYTREGAIEDNLDIQNGVPFPQPLADFYIGAEFSWELDIWGKLRNAKRAAASRYLASIEGRNFMVTNLVAEISGEYYELLALDNQLAYIRQNINLQDSAFNIVREQKNAGRVSQLAVNRFEAQLLNTQNLQYEVQQRIVETENHINFLVGRFPQPVVRNPAIFNSLTLDSIYIGVPSQLLMNRPDIRQAENNLIASKLDVKSARASFYPSIRLSAGVGFEAFNPTVWFNPASIIGNVLGGLIAPLINRNALKAAYNNANARQMQAVYNYEKSILNGYIEVVNQLSAIQNYGNSYKTKSREVQILTESVGISINLFNSARADYMEVLLTQREALHSRMELIEIKMKLLHSQVKLYKALGGGWR